MALELCGLVSRGNKEITMTYSSIRFELKGNRKKVCYNQLGHKITLFSYRRERTWFPFKRNGGSFYQPIKQAYFIMVMLINKQ